MEIGCENLIDEEELSESVERGCHRTSLRTDADLRLVLRDSTALVSEISPGMAAPVRLDGRRLLSLSGDARVGFQHQRHNRVG